MNAQMKRDKENFKKKLMALERKLKDEERQNENTVKFNKGGVVEYGNII